MLRGGFEHLAHPGQGYGYHQIVECVVLENFIVEEGTLAALHDDGQTGLIHRGHAHCRRAGTNQRKRR